MPTAVTATRVVSWISYAARNFVSCRSKSIRNNGYFVGNLAGDIWLTSMPRCEGCLAVRVACPLFGRLLASALQLCCVCPKNLEPISHGSSTAVTLAVCIQVPAQDPPVPALDSAGCSCGCHVGLPSCGAVVTDSEFRADYKYPYSRLSQLNSLFIDEWSDGRLNRHHQSVDRPLASRTSTTKRRRC